VVIDPGQREAEMETMFLVIVFAFVIAVLALVAYSVFEVTPLAHHKDHYRDDSGKRRFESPWLD
jgi:uncharacterized protein HemY